MRASPRIAGALVVAVLLISALAAAADDAPALALAPAPPPGALALQLEAQTQAIDRALAAVADKLAAADEARNNRLRAAYRALHAVTEDDAVAVARRRAAVRWLVDRDAAERKLLVDEAARLQAARARIAGELAGLASVELPRSLSRPAAGKIARRFGTLLHERSKATLARRGLDLEVDERSPVTAPAPGIVRYTGPIRGLDQGVVLDHGTYITVVAKLGDVVVPLGAQVAAGDRIGRAARHRVYLEVRVKVGPGGHPIDPEPLLSP